MQLNKRIALGVVVTAVLAACSATPERNNDLEMARQMVPEVEKSDRAGIAATDISNARKSLDAANKLDSSKGKRADIEYQAQNAVMSAQIAGEKISTAMSREEIDKGTEQRQAVLIQAREREVQRSAAAADQSRQQADASQRRSEDSQLRADSLEVELADLKAKKTERGVVLILGDVLFDTAQATLKTGAYDTLDRLASTLRDRPTRSVAIEGHTDNVGSEDNNQSLSERRARAVQSALQQRGVDGGQISVLGRGESAPIDSNESESGRRQNRRVELIFSEDRPV